MINKLSGRHLRPHVQNGGITLIALIITVIVMLILAGVAISAISNSGLFIQIRDAVGMHNNVVDKEQEGLDYISNMMEMATTPLKVELSYSNTAPTNQSVIVTITTNKLVNTPDGWIKKDNLYEYTKVYEENTVEAVTITGLVGSVSVEVKIENIDKVRPVVGNVTVTVNSVTFTATDEGLGINGYAVTTSSTAPTSGWTDVSPATHTLPPKEVGGLTQDKTYYIWVKDRAGNVNEEKLIVTTVAGAVWNYNTVTGGNNFIVPVTGMYEVEVAGGGGGGTTSGPGTGNGGRGGLARSHLYLIKDTVIPYVVGGGGGNASWPGVGSGGGTSSFGSPAYLYATGGNGNNMDQTGAFGTGVGGNVLNMVGGGGAQNGGRGWVKITLLEVM